MTSTGLGAGKLEGATVPVAAWLGAEKGITGANELGSRVSAVL